MAGSLLPMLYRTDIPDDAGTGFKYLILKLDESNSKALGGEAATDANIAGKEFATQGTDYLKIEPRYVLLEGKTTGGVTVRRKWVAPDPTDDLYAEGGTVQGIVNVTATTIELVTFSVSGMVGEKRTVRRPLLDSGLDDGTAA